MEQGFAQMAAGVEDLRRRRDDTRGALADLRAQVEEEERQLHGLRLSCELGRAQVQQLERNLLQLDAVLAYAEGQAQGWKQALDEGKENKDATEGAQST